ncbi:hypothetical protein BO71DRAFT_321503 [Aspergillus ellipticus CBS 707.79]|uniref:Uncharacterized protein n=1 Tax=Aspergillus ellipticus CBS 707.79 TaxID=1448320 RepID=A0A319DF92_9EURO|nr:hypothetical protein BO71DRAFT_321503 [Aspergillus ellipticus CBS 707.79]
MATTMHEQKIDSMPPTGGEGCRPPGEHSVHMDRSVDPHSSVEDYSRVMLEYTQRRMAGFADLDDGKGGRPSRSSRSSQTSGNSGTSTSGFMARQAAGPTSAAGPHDASESARRQSSTNSSQLSF